MKNYIILISAFFWMQFSQAQTEVASIEKTLQNYINGSSYNNLKQIESAFVPDATLYLTGKDGFKTYTPKEYANFFKNKEEGIFNGRVGSVLSVDVYKDIATAKASIVIEKVKATYIDLFLLKKTEAGWKIISKTATKIDTI